jgi:hypothetical protein
MQYPVNHTASGLNKAAKAGISVGSIVAGLAAASLLFYWLLRGRRKKEEEESDDHIFPPGEPSDMHQVPPPP